MDSTNSKVSFIPKGPLIRNESFLERKHPQSVLGFFAIFVLIVSIGSYVGFYFYNASLLKDVNTRTEAIKDAQTKFNTSAEVAQVKIFRTRAQLIKELLDAHVVVSPVYSFLSSITLESIMYEKFLFTRVDGKSTLELSGEAPTYASLAYQADKLREKIKKELSSFSIENVTLNKFGNVSFTLKMVFSPNYLSYTSDHNTPKEAISIGSPVITSGTAGVKTSDTTTVPVIVEGKWWSKLKFW